MHSRFANYRGRHPGVDCRGHDQTGDYQIIEDFPDLTEQDIQACLEYAADREQHTTIALTPH
jgi:hypothetical protein